jgi:hypothetical protein
MYEFGKLKPVQEGEWGKREIKESDEAKWGTINVYMKISQ